MNAQQGRPDSILLQNGRIRPIWRAVLYILAFFISAVVAQTAVVVAWIAFNLATGVPLDQLTLAQISNLSLGLLLPLSVLQFGVVFLITFLFRRFIDRAPLVALGLDTHSGWLREVAVGFTLGLVAMTLVFTIERTADWATVQSVARSVGRTGLVLLSYVVTYLAVAGTEELMFRGYILQTLLEWPGKLGAVVISALIFAVFHGLNPAISVLALVHLTIAGLVFAGAYLATRRLWLPIGLHFAWNFFQGPIFGFPVSGLPPGGLEIVHATGPAWLTGAAFGPEGGLLGLGALLFCGAGIWAWTRTQTREKTT